MKTWLFSAVFVLSAFAAPPPELAANLAKTRVLHYQPGSHWQFPASYFAVFSLEEAKRICPLWTAHNQGKTKEGHVQQFGMGKTGKTFFTSDAAFALGCDDSRDVTFGFVHIAFPSYLNETQLSRVSIRGRKYIVAKFRGPSAEHMYDMWDVLPSEREGVDANGRETYFPTKEITEEPDATVILRCKTGVNAEGDGEDHPVAFEDEKPHYFECWGAIALDEVVEVPAGFLAKRDAAKQPGGTGSAPTVGGVVRPAKAAQRWEVQTTNDQVVLTDHDLRLQWAIQRHQSRGGQTEVARSLGEAEGVCASMGFQLARVNSFMDVHTHQGKVVKIDPYRTREYWPKIYETFSPYFASGQPKFYTADSGPAPLMGNDAVAMFQPFKHPKINIYPTHRQLYGEVICVRQF